MARRPLQRGECRGAAHHYIVLYGACESSGRWYSCERVAGSLLRRHSGHDGHRLRQSEVLAMLVYSEHDGVSEISLSGDGGPAERSGSYTLASIRRISLVVLLIDGAGRVLL